MIELNFYTCSMLKKIDVSVDTESGTNADVESKTNADAESEIIADAESITEEVTGTPADKPKDQVYA